MAMRIDVATLFPDWIAQLGDYGVVGRGIRASRLAVHAWNPRDYSDDPGRRVDDRPYGGGPGMVMRVQPLARTLAAITAARGDRALSIMLSPVGERFDQRWARRLAAVGGCVLVCGRYEGVDRRFIDAHIDLELSIGDFVVSGGELPAMLVIDAIARLLDGVLGDARSASQDSFAAEVLDHPHYTRPQRYQAQDAPEVLLSGDHAAIGRWREKRALGVTWLRRPELLAQVELSERQRTLLAEYIAESGARGAATTDHTGLREKK